MKIAAAQTLRVSAGIAPQGSCSRKLRGGRDRPPYIAAVNGRFRTKRCRPPDPAAGRCKASAPTQARWQSVVPRFLCPFALYCPADVHVRRARSAKAETLRVSASITPQGSCSRKPPRRARSPALHCSRERAVSHKTLPPARPGGGPMQSIGPYAGSVVPRKDTCKARRRTPQSADADSSPCRGAFQAPKGSPARGCRVERPDGLLPPCPAGGPLSPKHSPPSL